MEGPSAYQRAAFEYATPRIGDRDRVRAHRDARERGTVLVAEVPDSPRRGMRAGFTIGLAETGVQLQGEGGELRVELLVAGRAGDPLPIAGLANCALNLSLDAWETVPGSIHTNAFGASADRPITARHAFVWLPVHWTDDFPPFTAAGITARWLEVLPITDDEAAHVLARGDGPEGEGSEALMRMLAAQRMDLTDFSRDSVRFPGGRRRWFGRR